MKKSHAVGGIAGAVAALSLVLSRRRTGAAPRLPTWKIVVAVLLLLTVSAVLASLMFVNPHMRDQPKAMPFRALLSAAPVATQLRADAHRSDLPVGPEPVRGRAVPGHARRYRP
jgi:hypothetical protein